jgi:hypothetical protein
MGAGKGMVRKQGSGNSPGADDVGQSWTPEESLKQARMQAHVAMPKIIDAIVEQALTGSCQHAKFLMEFAVEEPVQERAAAAVDPDEESLASILLRELRESEAEDKLAG